MGELIVRYAWEDQYPAGADLHQKARDSVIRFGMWSGRRWRWPDRCTDFHGVRGFDGQMQGFFIGMFVHDTGVAGWRSVAEFVDD